MAKWALGFILVVCLSAGVNAQEAAVFFDGCSVLDSGSPWKDHVMYTFSIQAGADSVNDLHVCIFDRWGEPVEIIAISHPSSWNGHFDAGSNCIDYWTNGTAVAPGQLFGTFDFIVPPGFCAITIEWVFTYAGEPVASGVDTWTCVYTEVEPDTWSAIKALYQ